MVSAAEILGRVLKSSLAPRERLTVDRWADRHRVIASKDAVEPGPWRTDRVPYMRRPMRMACHPLVRQVALMTASQIAKTETVDTIKLFWICEAPGPTLVMFSTIDTAVEYNQDRFIPNLKACAPARAHMTTSAQDVKGRKIDLDNCVFWFAGSNSEPSRRGKSARYVPCDEIDSYVDPGWVEVFERVKARSEYMILGTSTPSDEGVGIHALYRSGDRESYFVPCPHCGKHQKLRFGTPGRPGRLAWEGGGSASEAQAKATAHYVCIRCEGQIWNWHKPDMLAAGVWVPEGAEVEACLERDRLAEGTEYGLEPSPPENASFQLSSLYSPFEGASFGEVAKSFVKSRGVMTPKFVNGWLGEPFVVAGDKAEVGELKRLCIPADAGGYRMGEVPLGVLAVTAAVDVQADCLYVEVRGWGARGEDTWLIEALRLEREKGRGLVELDRWLLADGGLRRWKSLSGRAFTLDSLVLDSGHFTDETYTAVRRLNSARVRTLASKGQGVNRTPMKKPYQLTLLDKWPNGDPMPGGVQLLNINSEYWKTKVLGRIMGRPAEAEIDGQEQEYGVVPGFYLPEAAGALIWEWLDHMTSEHRVMRYGTARRPGALMYEWAMRPGRTENHFWDCCCYNFALAEFRGVRTLGAAPAAPAPPATPRNDRPPSTRELLNG